MESDNKSVVNPWIRYSASAAIGALFGAKAPEASSWLADLLTLVLR